MKILSSLPVFDQWGLMDEASETVAYYGFPASGSIDAEDPTCAIMKVETSENVTTRKFSNGSTAQNVKWSDRATLTYKFL